MRKAVLVFLLLIITLSVFVYASDYSGDGTYDVKKGDTITLDNGWKIVIKSIGLSTSSPLVGFDYYGSNESLIAPSNIYDPSTGDTSSGQARKVEGEKKFGTSTYLRIKVEVLEVSGETLSTAGVSWAEKENARINVVSIDEALPGAIKEGNQSVEEVNKVLTYKNGKDIKLSLDDETILGNGYKLKLDSFDQRLGSPYFSLFDENGTKIDEGIIVGKGASRSLGSVIYVKDYDTSSVELTIVDGQKVNFPTGWSLFSIYLEDDDGYGTILESTCNKGTIWSWNIDLKDYEKVGILEEGTKIPAGKGLWIKAKTKKNTISDQDCEIIVSGKKLVTTKSVQLKSGWNLIGAPISAYGKREFIEGGSNFNLLDLNDILGNCRIEKGPWQFVSGVSTGGGDAFEINKFSKPLQNKLRLTRGYFIKVIDDCMLQDK